MTEWNKDQQEAIDTRDKGVVVSAAAGSGKTAVLSKRTSLILADCENKLPADRLLAVTFTNEAADQMRRKLTAALDERLSGDISDGEKKWLSSQRDLISLARISTINSFCLDLVKRCLNEFEFEEGVRILDENDAETILLTSFEQALEEYAESSPDSFGLLYDKLGSTGDIISMARQLYDFLRSLPFPEEWFSLRLAELESGSAVPAYIDTLAYSFEDRLERAEKLNETIRHNIDKFPELDDALKGNIAALDADLTAISAIRHAMEDGDWDKLWYAVHTKLPDFSKTPNKKKQSFPPDLEALYTENGKLRDNEKKQIGAVKEAIEKIGLDVLTPLKQSAEIMKELRAVVKRAEKIAYRHKLDRNALEFSDVEIMALSLLVRREGGKTVRTGFAEELRQSREFGLLLIDEFQDVNDLQELIFKALSDTDDLEVFGNNVFVVGDVKQSIYSFRLSNPKLFIKAREAAAEKKNSKQLHLVELKSNYRSRGCVIDFVNLIFSQIMSEEIGEVSYTGGERLHQGAKYQGMDAPTEVIFVNNNYSPAAASTDDDDDESEELFIDENYAIAKRIRQLLDEGTLVYDKPDSQPRPCVPRDFCILYRSGTAIESLKAALASYGLKAAAEKSKGYLRSREISLMMSILRMIDNPMRDIPMAAVMLSPIMGFTADELARIRLLSRQKKTITDGEGNERETVVYQHLYQVIASIGQESEESHAKESTKLTIGDKALEKKCAEARKLVRKLTFYSAGMELSALIRKIYDETNLMAAIASYENSRQKRANLRLLLEYARAYCENNDGSPAGFIRYIENISASGKDFTQAATEVEDTDSVLVKTIHASKGLEFPFVFMCGLTRQFNQKDIYKHLLLDEEYGAGIVLSDRETLVKTDTLPHAAVRIIKRNKLLSEEMRLLYVAFTRAKERLFLPINMKYNANGVSVTGNTIRGLAMMISQAGGVTPRIVSQSSSYINWIAAALLCSRNRQPLLDKLGITVPLPAVSENADIVYSEYYPEELSENGESFYHGSAESSKVEALMTRFIGKASQTKEPAAAKLSVTEIVSREKEEQQPDKLELFYPQLPVLDSEKGSLTPAQRGTCTHLFMELANYSEAEKSVRQELQRLTDQGFFTEKEKKGVYVSAIEKFFSGDFYARMKRSPVKLREKKFLVSYDELGLPDKYKHFLNSGSMLQGVADCLFLEDDAYILVDYKTDDFKDISELYTYQTQLELYKYALNKILDKPVKACYIYSFRLSQGAEIKM